MAKKRAYQTYYRDKNGELRVQLVDAETGQPVANPKEYDVIDSTQAQGDELTGGLDQETDAPVKNVRPASQSEFSDPKANYFNGGNRGGSSGKGKGRKGSITNKFGYINKPGWAKYASLIPGPIGKVAAVANLGVNANNVSAVNQAREYLGLEPLGAMDTVKGVVTGMDKGKVGDVKIGDKSYGVSLNEAVIDGKTQLTAQEARQRQDLRSIQDQVEASIKDFNPQSKLHTELDPSYSTKETSVASNANLSPQMRGLLDTISGTESPSYDTMYGGTKFSSYEDHPRQAIGITSGPNKGRTSSAAGKYQMLGSTWDRMATKLGLDDFSPENQDIAAAELAREAYSKAYPGQTLDEALANNELGKISTALAGTWTSLPSGIEATTTTSKFAKSYEKNLAQRVKTSTVAPSPEDVGTMDEGLAAQGFKPGNPTYDAYKQLDQSVQPAAMVDPNASSFQNYSKSFYSKLQKDMTANPVHKEASPGTARNDSMSSGRQNSTTFGGNANRPASGQAPASSNFGRSDSPSSGRSSLGGSSFGSSYSGRTGGGLNSPSEGGSRFGGGGLGSPSTSTGQSYSGKGGQNSPSEGNRFGGSGLGSSTSNKDKDNEGATGNGLGGFGGPR